MINRSLQSAKLIDVRDGHQMMVNSHRSALQHSFGCQEGVAKPEETPGRQLDPDYGQVACSHIPSGSWPGAEDCLASLFLATPGLGGPQPTSLLLSYHAKAASWL
ncbi:hypothetical protein WJX74_001371 [Apatococcus lobatus]|uniref:Uncharacterized protein n=1 Tax=Apatococcus lobatus TaxID=904363 RepID=A0AAW1RK76_9CHLO